MARWSEGGWKERVYNRGMEESPENGKELLHVKLHVHRLQRARSIDIIWPCWLNIKGGKMVQYMFQWSPLGRGGGWRRNDKDEPRYKESKHTYFIMRGGTWNDWLLWELKVASAWRVKAKKKNAVRITEKCYISIHMQELIKP